MPPIRTKVGWDDVNDQGPKINNVVAPTENTDRATKKYIYNQIGKVSNALDLLYEVVFWGLLDRLALINYDLSDIAINAYGKVIMVANVIGSNHLVRLSTFDQL